MTRRRPRLGDGEKGMTRLWWAQRALTVKRCRALRKGEGVCGCCGWGLALEEVLIPEEGG